MGGTDLELADWRRRVSELYAAVRTESRPERAHALWRAGRDELLLTHPQSPLPPADPLRSTGLPYWAYNPELRLVGQVDLPSPLGATINLWWLRQYAGGLFLPLRDGTAGKSSYGGGRYLLDTAKGAGVSLSGTPTTFHVLCDPQTGRRGMKRTRKRTEPVKSQGDHDQTNASHAPRRHCADV